MARDLEVVEVVPRHLEGKRDQREVSAIEGLYPYTQNVGGIGDELAEGVEPGDVVKNCLGLSQDLHAVGQEGLGETELSEGSEAGPRGASQASGTGSS